MTSKQFAIGTVALFITIGITHCLGSAKVKASCPTPLLDGDFEAQTSPTVSSPWVSEGKVGIDRGMGNSNSAQNNVWMRNVSGWNGISQRIKLQPNTEYELKAYIRTSENVTDGSFGVRDANQKAFIELKFGRLGQYVPLTLRFVTGNEPEYHIFTGFWAVGQDSWVQVDNYTLTGSRCKQEEQGKEGQEGQERNNNNP
ncbi:hypothetical protein BV372_11395 [Nostoc sp. T09]|uniref:hypothetical protein n=1 Tax=Nostoc sp. T09 TaxID=1932621 RepID=UPI000B688870|nr:hypothetical protein [Nostoc sp. T09]OUL35440.1 hypothetical protein BV372_11395 [Nostoc sp. T09]